MTDWLTTTVILLALLGAQPATANDAPPANPSANTAAAPVDQFELVEGVEFCRVGDVVLKLDMATPQLGEAPRPAVVCLFGGGWISGSRRAVRDHIEYLAAHGFVAVAPDYRLAPEHPFPAAVADVRQCVRWLRRNADKYGIDPDRIGAVGYSAGGHLACMLGVTSDTDRFGADDVAAGGTSARVQAVVNYFGPGDMAATEWSDLAKRKYLVPFFGGTPEERPHAYRKASPVTHITADDPPILTLQGDKDRTVPMAIAVKLHERLEAAGVTNELVIVEGQGHGWKEPHRSRGRAQMVEFLNTHLRKPGNGGS